MQIDRSIPGFPEASEWAEGMQGPFRVIEAGIYRDGGTCFAVLNDSHARVAEVCFDRFLHRPIVGTLHPDDGDGVFVLSGSRMYLDILEALKRAENDPVLDDAHYLIENLLKWMTSRL